MGEDLRTNWDSVASFVAPDLALNSTVRGSVQFGQVSIGQAANEQDRFGPGDWYMFFGRHEVN